MRELVGVPAEQIVAAVQVERAEDAERAGELDLVLEGMAGEDGVVLLDVDLDLVLEVVGLQHPVDGADVEIVLVLGRLLRLRLDQDRALEADLLLVLDHHRQEAAELRELALHVGVEQRLVALAPAPEHVVRAAELVRHVERVLHLRGGVGEDFRVGVGGGAGHEAAVGEEVRRAPEQLAPSTFCIFFAKMSAISRTLRFDLGERRAFRRDVAVVEGEERHAEQLEHLEGDVGLELRLLHVVAEPGPQEGLAAERVGARPGEGVPVADGEAEMILHALAEHLPVRVVPAEGEGIAAFRPLVADRLLVAEKAGAHDFERLLDGGIERAIALRRRRDRLRPRPRRARSFAGLAGGVQTAIGSASSAAIRPSRAAPNAPPKSPSAGTSIGMFRTLAMICSQAREREPPPTAVARSTLRAGRLQRLEAVGEGEGDAFHHGAGQRRAVGLVRQADEAAARAGIVVRRALAGEVGQEEERLLGRPAPSTDARSSSPALAPVTPASHSSEAAAERMTPIWCQVFGSAWQKAWTALAAFGRNFSLETKSTPDVPSETKAEPGATVPTPQADAALSPAPPATTGAARHAPAASRARARSLPVGSVPSKSAGIWSRCEMRRGEELVRPVALARRRATTCRRNPTCRRRGRR